MTRNETMLAVALEVGPGTLLQTFGLGHFYAGRGRAGLLIMVAYWMAQAINALLVPLWGLGLITGFLTWLGFVVFAPTNLLGSSR